MLRQLEAFIHVVEQQSFSKAAELMYLSQPSISNYIRNLETEYSTVLLYRHSKEITPTMAGKTFYTFAKNMVSMEHHLNFAMDGLGEHKYNLTIYATPLITETILPTIIGDFATKYPKINIRIHTCDHDSLLAEMKKGSTEFILMDIKNKDKSITFFHKEPVLLTAARDAIIPKVLTIDAVNRLQPFIYAHNEMEGVSITPPFSHWKTGADKQYVGSSFLNVLQMMISMNGFSFLPQSISHLFEKSGLIKSINFFDTPQPMGYIEYGYMLNPNLLLSPLSQLFLESLATYNPPIADLDREITTD